MIQIDDNIKGYRIEKDKKFEVALKEIRSIEDFMRRQVQTSSGMITIDIYKGKTASAISPVYFNFHGGGFVLGYHELDGPYCRFLADQANCVVINIDYLLAPEHKFPEPLTSALEAVTWCLSHHEELGIDSSNVVLGGHSAGGNLAAGITYLYKEKGIATKGLIMDYAPCSQDISCLDDLNDENKIKLDRSLQYISWYFTDSSQLTDPLASPCLMDTTGFPETLMISAEYDPLRKGEEEMKQNLGKHHIPVEYHCFMGCGHGFTHRYYDEYHESKARDAWNIMKDFLIRCFNDRHS